MQILNDPVMREAVHHFTQVMDKISTNDKAEIAEATTYLTELAQTNRSMHDLVVRLVEMRTGIAWDTFA